MTTSQIPIDDPVEQLLNPLAKRTIYDSVKDKHIVLSDEEIKLIKRISDGSTADPNSNQYIDLGNYYTRDVMEFPINDSSEPKRRFIPSKNEKQKILRLVTAIRNGWIRTKETHEDQPLYMLWNTDGEEDRGTKYKQGRNRLPRKLPAPKPPLPGHIESYNPPDEYLLDDEEIAEMEENEDEEDIFLPKKYSSLRKVPGYDKFTDERYNRCRDLIDCPRLYYLRAHVDPESLLPDLPLPATLRPYPEKLLLTFTGHMGQITSLSVSGNGQWLVTASLDSTVRIWEVDTTRCFGIYSFPNKEHLTAISFNPTNLPVIALAVENRVILLHTLTGNEDVNELALKLLSKEKERKNLKIVDEKEKIEIIYNDNVGGNVVGEKENQKQTDIANQRIELFNQLPVSQLSWHRKGDFLSTLCKGSSSNSNLSIHRLSNNRTVVPFKKTPKSSGIHRSFTFIPNSSRFAIASDLSVRIFDSEEGKKVGMYKAGTKLVSVLAAHPSGQHILVGGEDAHVVWLDLELASRPLKIIKLQPPSSVVSACFHSTFPLFAVSTSDGKVHILHYTLYDDYSKEPFIVPVSQIQAHSKSESVGCSCVFHPTQPWIFTCGGDNLCKLWY